MPLTFEQIATIDFPEFVSEATIAALMDPPIPHQDPVIDRAKLEQWVALHQDDKEIYKVAKKIAENITYVSFEEFYASLKACAQELNKYFAENNLKSSEVIIADPYLTTKRSNLWVMGLLLNLLDLVPCALTDCTRGTLSETLKKHPGVKKILIADDASYSATDLSLFVENISSLGREKKIEVCTVVPYITQPAIERLRPFCTLFYHQIMKTMNDIDYGTFDKAKLNFLQISGAQTIVEMNRITLYYFAHKMADNYAVAEKILKYGVRLDVLCSTDMLEHDSSRLRKLERVKFIPDIEPCYKESVPKRRLSEFLSAQTNPTHSLDEFCHKLTAVSAQEASSPILPIVNLWKERQIQRLRGETKTKRKTSEEIIAQYAEKDPGQKLEKIINKYCH